ncbi:hypothetical protein ACFQ78_03255 [Streptomyces sp. NPDC056519]|uniref:hypothetical protein n=1 Tax=Streptomyces sp. NPDC056519 TaxID=3345849 RepID=UPI0036ACA604
MTDHGEVEEMFGRLQAMTGSGQELRDLIDAITSFPTAGPRVRTPGGPPIQDGRRRASCRPTAAPG